MSVHTGLALKCLKRGAQYAGNSEMNAVCLTFHLGIHLKWLKLFREVLTRCTIERVPCRPQFLCLTRERRIARSSTAVTLTAFLRAPGDQQIHQRGSHDQAEVTSPRSMAPEMMAIMVIPARRGNKYLVLNSIQRRLLRVLLGMSQLMNDQCYGCLGRPPAVTKHLPRKLIRLFIDLLRLLEFHDQKFGAMPP